MSCSLHDQEAHYHFTLCDMVDYVIIYGMEKVLQDLHEELASRGNKALSQYEMELS
jgi:hypothetical protein